MQPLAKPGNPWFGSAGEMTAMALIKQGKNAEAGQLFAQDRPRQTGPRKPSCARSSRSPARSASMPAARCRRRQLNRNHDDQSDEFPGCRDDCCRVRGQRLRHFQEGPGQDAGAGPAYPGPDGRSRCRRRPGDFGDPDDPPGAGRQHRVGAIGRQRLQVDGPACARYLARTGLYRPGRARQQPDRAPRGSSGRRRRPRLHHRHPRRRSAPSTRRMAASIWASQTPNDRGNEASLYGGGIAYDNGFIYATNGLGYVSALDVRSGGIVWKVRPGGPLRGAPTVANDAVYVMSQDNQIYSLKESDGTTNWSQAASLEIAGVFGIGFAGRRPGHGRRRLLVGRAQRLPLRKRPPGVAGRAPADQHPHQRLHRCRTSTPTR